MGIVFERDGEDHPHRLGVNDVEKLQRRRARVHCLAASVVCSSRRRVPEERDGPLIKRFVREWPMGRLSKRRRNDARGLYHRARKCRIHQSSGAQISGKGKERDEGCFVFEVNRTSSQEGLVMPEWSHYTCSKVDCHSDAIF